MSERKNSSEEIWVYEFTEESAGSFSLERRDDSTVLLNIRDPNNSQLVQLGYVGDQLYGVVAHDVKHDGSDDDFSDQNEEVSGDKEGEKKLQTLLDAINKKIKNFQAMMAED